MKPLPDDPKRNKSFNYSENSEEDAADEDADAVEGELGRRVAAVGQAILVLQTG